MDRLSQHDASATHAGALPPSAATAAPALLRLQVRAAARYATCEVAVPLAGAIQPLRITLPADPDAPLDAMAARQHAGPAARSGMRDDAPTRAAPAEAAASATRLLATGAHLPYWALLWPSGQALAEALLTAPQSFAGKRVLELGCGLGVTAAAALRRGVRLWAADGFPEALLFMQVNCLRNAGGRPHPLLLNWRAEAGRAACRALAPFDLVLAADVLYETDDIMPLLDLVPTLLATDGAFWLAEPGRRVSRQFVTRAREAGWHDELTTVCRAWPPDDDIISVAIHRFLVGGSGKPRML